MYKPEEFLYLLVEENIIDALKSLEIKDFLNKNPKISLDDFLIKNKILDAERITQIKAKLYHLPYKTLDSETISDEAVNFLSKELAKNYHIVCFNKDKNKVDIGLVDFDLRAIEAVNFLAQSEHLQAEFYLVSDASFNEALKKYDKLEEEISTALEVKAKAEGEDLLEIQDEGGDMLNEVDVNSAPIAKIVSVIIRHAVEARASDIHIEPYANESRIRYRIDGILHTSLVLPKSVHNSVVARIKVLSKLKLDETRIPQDGHIRLIIDNREIDFRISTLPLGGTNNEKVVMRILDQSKSMTTLEQMGFNSYCFDIINESIKKTSGIILITGPTGSGKSTTLYGVLDILNKEGINISTLEDPVERQIKGVNQSQIRPELGFTFATGLRAFLRQDPNIIMVGEIRDQETAELAIQAGLTGHLVLSTLHTNDAIGAISRLIDMKAETFLLASTLRTVIAQRLARRLCNECKKVVTMPPKVIEDMIQTLQGVPLDFFKKELPGFNSFEDVRTAKFYDAVGCSRCSNTGYRDRVAVAEAVVINDALKSLIITEGTRINAEVVQKNQMFISMRQDGIMKILKGMTNLNEVLRVIEIGDI